MLFSSGFFQALLAVVWWSSTLWWRSHGYHETVWWGMSWAHPVMMVYGIFPSFVFGFLLTTFPAWLNQPAIKPVHTLPVAGLMILGGALCYAGLLTDGWVMAAGLALMLVGWLVAGGLLGRVLFVSKQADRRHAFAAAIGLSGGAVGLLAALLWVWTHGVHWLALARVAGVWFFLLPVFMTVSHRMIPFFSSRVLRDYVVVRPYALLWVMLAASLWHGCLMLWSAEHWLWTSDVPLVVCAGYLAWQWKGWRSAGEPLLAVLHVGFMWFVCGMSLFVWKDASWLFGKWGVGLAPLHALTLGFFASMLMGMVSRVSLGHSGRALKLARLDYALFWLLQGVAVLRVVTDCLPVLDAIKQDLYEWAALVWLLALVVWAIRFVPMYWQARVDGKPG